MAGKGLDVGTHMLVAAQKGKDGVDFTEQVDAFFTLDATDESINLLEFANLRAPSFPF